MRVKAMKKKLKLEQRKGEQMLTPIQRHHVEPLVRTLTKNGQVFGVKFIKKDGTLRRMACRLGVKKGVTGAGKRWDRADYPNLLTVWDMNKKDFRNVNLDTVKEVKAKKQIFYVVE